MTHIIRITLSTALLYLALSSVLQAQSEYKLRTFDAISVSGNIQLTLQQGDEEKATVVYHGEKEEKLNIHVSGNELKISLLHTIAKREERAEIVITYRTLRTVRAHAGATVSSPHIISGDKLNLRATSGAKLNLDIKTNALEGSATEGGMVQLRGTTESQSANAATGGEYNALDVSSKRTFARASTGGVARVVALEEIDASANLGGTVEYKGDPDMRYRRTFIGGDVRKL